METMNWVSKRDLSPSVTDFFYLNSTQMCKALYLFWDSKSHEWFQLHPVSQCYSKFMYFLIVLFFHCIRQHSSKICSTKQRLFLWVLWLITVPLVCSLSMCRTHFRMPVGVLCAYEEEAIGDGICHVALRRKVCPQIV